METNKKAINAAIERKTNHADRTANPKLREKLIEEIEQLNVELQAELPEKRGK